ncbi:hypothetical protein HELRODRAFT_193403 [Helobdella robusta]|uniref:DNA polymerase n=1 Tax=Helobdella robusta TaxID=6412 RepID=T1FUY7_HELRO|nr:hypothetical protein HELRODRAFT_193403 [Helobdella robusta]ESN96944.1 hypothetical protein HELRODRAFT_193403 [Helobdella robusta]
MDENSDYSLARNRSKREKSDRHGRFAALAKLKEAKLAGEKFRPDILNEKNVYDEVDESEYSEIVRNRQEDDWIIDDGSGYVEDGRELFDEDIYDEPQMKNVTNVRNVSNVTNVTDFTSVTKVTNVENSSETKTQKKNPAGLATNPNIRPPNSKPSNIKSLFAAAAVKPKKKVETSADLEKDDLLMGLMEEMKKDEDIIQPTPVRLKKHKEPAFNRKITIEKEEVIELDGETPASLSSHSSSTTTAEPIIEQQQFDFDNELSWILTTEIPSTTEEKHELSYVTDDDGEKVLKMYWLDAFEDHFKHPGVVFLFGKVWVESSNCHKSCCIIVRNIERRIFILPRSKRLVNGQPTDEAISIADVYDEFNKHLSTNKLYAFEKNDVPMESDYLEVRYPATEAQIPNNVSGETFSEIFGTTTSSLEIFLIDRRLKGPCWLDIRKSKTNNPAVTWCAFELSLTRPEDVVVSSDQPCPPNICVMSLSLITYVNQQTKENEIIGASMLVNSKLPIDKPNDLMLILKNTFPLALAISKPNNCVFPFDLKEKMEKKMKKMKVEMVGCERALLTLLAIKIGKVDPDVIAGHDIAGFELDVLLHRLHKCKVSQWSKGFNNQRMIQMMFAGRLLCDVQLSARELIRCRSYDLTELTNHVLKERRKMVEEVKDVVYLFSSSEKLLDLMSCGMADCSYVFRIMCELNILPLALQITNICGNLMSRTLLGGRSERNEYLLLHAFNSKNFIVPDKIYKKAKQMEEEEEANDDDVAAAKMNKSSRRKPAYEGGLVLEPKKGFYDHFILLLDFNSLYPSIIQEYNICFTTVSSNNPVESGADGKSDEGIILNSGLPPGVLPTEIRKLVESRKQVRGLMKSCDEKSDLYLQYDIRQKALKLTANSMYGCLGFSSSRFYAKRLAALVTGKGREILLKTRDLVQAMGIEVIYGDTDSIMVNTGLTNYDEVIKLGNKIKSEVNKLYRLLEIDIDGVFKSMLLLKKKKYAALMATRLPDGSLVTKQESKGLDIVRRDWCPLAKEVGNYMLSQVFSGESREVIVENIHNKLFEVAQQVRQGLIPKELFYITKQLTRSPEDYKDIDSLPHVQVAARLNKHLARKLKAGDIIYYVICQNGTNDAATKRAYHPDELNKSDTLQIDANYYLSQQVHPVVARLCDPIEGTDAGHIAECLGLDAKSFHQTIVRRDVDGEEDGAGLAGGEVCDEEKYKDCERLTISCPSCAFVNVIESAYADETNVSSSNNNTSSQQRLTLERCGNSSCSTNLLRHGNYLKNRLTSFVRSFIRRYYDGWMRCEDVCCNFRTRKVPLAFKNGHAVCPACRKNALQCEFTEKSLYNQLCYLLTVFDVNYLDSSKADKRSTKFLKERDVEVMNELKEVIDQKMKTAEYTICTCFSDCKSPINYK